MAQDIDLVIDQGETITVSVEDAGPDADVIVTLGTGGGGGVTSISDVVGLQAALDGKASTTDARFTDSREWIADTVSQAEAEAGTATTRRAWTALRVFQAVAAWWAASSAKSKLDGIAVGATANATDSQLRDRSTHTGTQLAATVSDFASAALSAVTWSSLTGKPSTFTATAHAATHGSGGTDPITVAQSQVTGLSTALSGKADASTPTLTGQVTFAGDNSTTGTINGDAAYFSTLVFANLTTQTTAFTSTLKTKLDGIATNANNYSLPAATTSTLGGVIVGSGLSVSSGTVSANVTSVAGRTGAVTIAAADVSGLAAVATAGTFASLTSKPTTLSGYGITDAATSTHVHGNITNAGAIGSTANLPIITTTSGVLTTGAFGTTSNSFCQGNDARLVADGNKGDITVGSSNTSWTINAGAVVTADLADSAVTTAKIAALAVTDAKVNDVAASKLTGTIALARLPVVVEKSSAVGNSGTSTTLSLSSSSVQTVTLNGNCTFTMPTATAGATLTVILSQGGSNTGTFTGVKWPGGTAPTITTGAGKIDVLTFVSDGTNWYGVAVQNLA